MAFAPEQMTDAALLAARLLVAVVLCIAGVAKLLDGEGSRRSMIDFGVPGRLALFFGRAIPIVEILIGLALVPLATAWFGGIAALVLLTIFTTKIALKLARGEKADCHCFGQLQKGPIGWTTLARNLLLMFLAGLVVSPGPSGLKLSAVNWLADLDVNGVVSLLLSVTTVALLGFGFAYIRRLSEQLTNLLETVAAMKKVIDDDYAEAPPVERKEAALPVNAMPIGVPAPPFSLTSMRGNEVSLDDLLDYGKSVLLLFVSPTCTPCRAILDRVADWERDFGNEVTIALISKGTFAENKKRFGESPLRHVLLGGEDAVFDKYQAQWTPAAAVISRHGRTASRMAYGPEAIMDIVEARFSGRTARGLNVPPTPVGNSQLNVGDAFPGFSLSDLTGRVVRSEDLLGRDTLLLFWDPNCSFCQRMSADIRNWEDNAPPDAPRLVIISSGNADEVRASTRDIGSLVLLDDEPEIGPRLGRNGTPSGVLIDSEGVIASETAIGAPSVLALAGAALVNRNPMVGV